MRQGALASQGFDSPASIFNYWSVLGFRTPGGPFGGLFVLTDFQWNQGFVAHSARLR